MKNYYAILKVPDGSSLEDIHQAYQRLVPESRGNSAAFAELTEAYDALTTATPVTDLTVIPTPAVRCPMGAEAQCPVIQAQTAPEDTYCPECGYLLSELGTRSFETAGAADLRREIRLEEPGGRTHPLKPGMNLVGRESADILLPDKTVSRRHARLEVSADGTVTLEDLGSTNGTQAAGDRLAPNVPRRLASGDRVRFGSVLTELRLPEPTEGTSQAPAPVIDQKAQAQLVEMREEDPRTYLLMPGITTFGRRPDNTVVLPGDPYVSGSHAQILADGDLFHVTDIGSTNGTLLNGERLAINEPVLLTPGDVLLIGGTALRFERLDAEGNAVSEAPRPDDGLPAEPHERTVPEDDVQEDDVPERDVPTPLTEG